MKPEELERMESDPKKDLELKARQYLDLLQSEVKSVGTDAKKIGTVALVVGGVFLAAYLIGRKIKKKKPKAFNDPSLNQLVVAYPKKESTIARMIKEHITIFLIALVKEKLLAYLKEAEKKHEPVQ